MPLDNLKDFVNALTLPTSDVGNLNRLRVQIPSDNFGNIGKLYCPHCSEYSGMKLNTLHFERTVGQELYRDLTREDTIGGSRPKALDYSDPSLFMLNCVNCPNAFFVLLYRNEGGPTIVFFSVRGGGVATLHTPELVKYYLEQAYRAQAASAYSAALTMYRGALEQLLEDKKYKGKLREKLLKLTKDIENSDAPVWARRLNPESLTVIKEIADAHAHPSKLSQLLALDTEFMSKVQKTFLGLLKVAYEQEPRQAAAKAKLAAALQKAKRKVPNSP